MISKGFVAPPFLIWVVVGLLALTLASKNGVVKFDLSGNRSILQPQNSNIPVPIPNPITDTDLINPVKQFYSNISSKQYDVAWSLLSKNFQNYAQNYDNFISGYKTTLNTVIKDIRVQDLSDPKVYVQLESSDNLNGQVQTKTFEGTWKLVMENGQWKLDIADIALKNVSPTPKPVQIYIAPIPTPKPTPTPNPNEGKEATLKLIDEKISKLNQSISVLQAVINSLYVERGNCNFAFGLRDPVSGMTAHIQCTQNIQYSIQQYEFKIQPLLQEKNDLERQKSQIMAQP